MWSPILDCGEWWWARALDALRVQAARQDEQALQKVVATHDELAAVRAVVGPGIRAFVEAGFGEDARYAPVTGMRGRKIALHERPRRRLRRFAIARALRLGGCNTGEPEESRE